jgi:hypothetical protein
MNTLVDLGRHMAWADAESWRAYESKPGVLETKPFAAAFTIFMSSSTRSAGSSGGTVRP